MSIQKRAASFLYALNGLKDLFRSQPNARIHLVATALVMWAGWYFKIERFEWIAVGICVLVVLALEAVNTAIEYLTDLISPEIQPLAGKAKDVAAAAVLLAAVGSVGIAAMIFLPRISAKWLG